MCGIVGVIIKGKSGLMAKHENSFFDMLYADALRGFDSTGVIGVENTGAFTIMKEAVEAAWFLPQLKDSKLKKDMYTRGKVYIGHNRKKTVGEINDEQAHPFVVDKTFAFVHNGTLHGHKLLAETTTDSQALAVVMKKALEADNYKEALEETLGRVWGAYATVMYDQVKEKVYFLRNKERPLFIIEAPDAVYFASEGMMATWILCRNDYKYSDLKVSFLDEHSLGTYDLEKNTLTYEVLVPKKAYTTTSTSSKGGGTNTKTDIAANGNTLKAKLVSKSQFKLFKRQWIGKRARLWVEDACEINFPRTMDEDGETKFHLWGKLDDCDVAHTCLFDVDVSDHGLNAEEEIYETQWTAMVDDVVWSDSTQSAVIYMTHAKPIVKAITTAPTQGPSTIGHRVLLETRLETLSLSKLEKEIAEKSHLLMKWERDCYYNEINRKRIAVAGILKQYHKLGLEAVLDDAKKKGIEVKSELRNGRMVYFDDKTSEVLYESSVALH
jgi:hypothetical protein